MEETLQLQQTERKKGLSTAALKWIALGLMVLDHIHYFFGFTGWVPEAFTMLGRLSANLFLFCVVEGFAHTHDRKRYFLRIWAIGAAMGAVLTAFMFVPALQRPDGFWAWPGRAAAAAGVAGADKLGGRAAAAARRRQAGAYPDGVHRAAHVELYQRRRPVFHFDRAAALPVPGAQVASGGNLCDFYHAGVVCAGVAAGERHGRTPWHHVYPIL